MHNYTTYLLLRLAVPITASLWVLGAYMISINEIFHLSNHRFYRETRRDERAYRALDENLDLYRYVEDIKHNYDYKGGNMWNIKRKYLRGLEEHEDKEVIQIMRDKYDPNRNDLFD